VNFSGVSNKTLIGRLLRLPLRLIPPQTVIPILQGRLRGRKWIVGSGTHGYWLGSYEYPKQRAFEKLIKAGDVVFDIGAHAGFYTVLAATLCGPRGQVIAFEPLPRNLNFLKSHIRINHLPNVRVIEAAASDTEGSALFKEGESGSVGHLSEGGKLPVKTVRVDGLVASGEIPPPTHMKIDVEGAEFKVLLGSKSVLAAHHPTIFLATHGSQLHVQCCEFLWTLGYRLAPISGGTLDSTDEVVASAEIGVISH
jgi:FkbM family methyltransferase